MKFKRAMLVLILIVICIGSTNSMSIGSVSDKNVTKRVARASNNLLPDWVPFKNKNGEELGEFVQVEQKSKPKKRKRLALPTNFVLKAVAEPQDDYYDKGQGEGDGGGEGDDYYEKKEWSDVYRDGQEINNNTLKTKSNNSTDLSDIDGVINIITKAHPIDKIIDQQKIRKGDKKTVEDKNEKENVENKTVLDTKENSGENDYPQQKVDPKEEYVKEQEYDKEVQTPEESKKQVTKTQKDDDTEYDESSEKRQTESEEKKESEAKKAKILNSVDELKLRHADEQREISERLKEEELQLEQYENDKITGKKEAKQQWKAYETPKRGFERGDSKEDSEDKFVLNDKYKINPPKRTTTAATTKSSRKKSRKRINKDQEEGKLSVFKNPKQYLIYDEETGEVITTTAKPKKTKKSRRPNPSTVKMEKLSTVPTLASEESVHISLVPDAKSKDGEPSLFFPKRRKSKRKRNKNKASTPATDSSAAETTDKKSKKDIVALGVTKLVKAVSAETGLSALESAPSALESAPSALESAPSAQEAVTDAVPASTHHEKKDEGPKNYHLKKGGGRDYHSEHEEEHGEHGKKAYEGFHEDTKTAKGHKDKEDHLGKYDDHGGHDDHHHDETGHYGAHHHEEHGKKHAKYEESGKHAKGHSTKGSHDVHKKEEYEKKVEFFEEDGDSDEEAKHGGYNHEREHSSGGHFKEEGLKAGHHEHAKGDTGHFEKGGHVHVHKGHKSSEGHDGHGKHGHEGHSKHSKNSGKKWAYHHGHPAKTANLVRIDRRIDKFAHGVPYFG